MSLENGPQEPRMEKIKGLDEAKNFEELYEVLKPVGTLIGSNGVFSSDKLISLIEDVRAGKEDVLVITRTGGLREKVQSLLENANKLPQMPQIGDVVVLEKVGDVQGTPTPSPIHIGEFIDGKLAAPIEVGKGITFITWKTPSPVTSIKIDGRNIIIETTSSIYKLEPNE